MSLARRLRRTFSELNFLLIWLFYFIGTLICFVFNEVSESHDREKTSCVGNHLPDILDLKGKIYTAAGPHAKGERTKRPR